MFYVSVLRPVNDSANDVIMFRCIAVLCFCTNENEKKIASEMPVPRSLEKYNTVKYRSSETVQSSGYFQGSVSYIKVQIMFT